MKPFLDNQMHLVSRFYLQLLFIIYYLLHAIDGYIIKLGVKEGKEVRFEVVGVGGVIEQLFTTLLGTQSNTNFDVLALGQVLTHTV